ncbi:T9SS type A sorting domain-containing protein [bacterium]|nr:T9SS type A sorting domain-containing protein [bacterium]
MTARTVLGGFCALLMITASAIAQPDSLWSRTYGGTSSDNCNSIQQTSDGGFVLAGTTYSFGPGNGDFWLMKTDANGDSLWSRTYGGNGDERCYSVQQTTDGGYALVGFTDSFDGEVGYGDFWLVKTDADGDSLWSNTYGGGNSDYCYSVQQTFDGGYALAGITWDDDWNFWLVKTDSNGDSLWSRTFGGVSSDWCTAVQQTFDGGYMLVGSTQSSGAGASDFWLVKTDANGDSLWSRTFGGSWLDECHSVVQTVDRGYALAGFTHSFGSGSSDFYMIKTDADGDTLWTRTFGGIAQDWCYSIQQTTDGGYAMAGYTVSFGAGAPDFWLVKTDANGDSLWSRTFGGSGSDECHSVQQTSDGGYILGGYTASYGAGDHDFWLVKTGPDPLAAEPLENPLPAEYTLHQNYPNPFNPTTQISYNLTKASHVSLKIFDLLGREVAILADEIHPAGLHHTTFDGSGLPSGIYFYHLQADDFAMTKKMVLLK